MDVIGHLLGGRQNLTEELHLAGTQRASAAGVALPAEIKADQLPHGIEAEATGHDRIALEMTGEEPEIRVDIQFSNELALAVFAAHFADVNDAINHQHVRRRQLRITGPEQLAAAATKQIFPSKGLLFGHAYSSMVPSGGLAALSDPKSGSR